VVVEAVAVAEVVAVAVVARLSQKNWKKAC